MNKTFKTPKGSELPLLRLRGKDYLEVKYRLVWFREEHPDWSIETEFVALNETSACAKAVLRDEKGRVIATSHKFENARGFPDFMEKAETGAIGRALALIGYGTQFCADELDEGERIVDAPVRAAPLAEEGGEPSAAESVSKNKSDAGDFVVSFGRKYFRKKVRDIAPDEIRGYLAWLESEADKKHAPLSYEAKLLKRAVDLYYGAPEEAAAPSPEIEQAS